MLKQFVAPFFIIICLVSQSQGAFSNSAPTNLLPALSSNTTEAILPEENIKVQNYEIEIGRTISLPAKNPTRYLIASPDVVSVLQVRPDAIELQAQKIGSTLLIWWEEGGIRSSQITATRPLQEIKKTQEIKKQSSKLYQLQKDRSFKVFYGTQYSILHQEKVLGRVTEVRKIYNHETGFHGDTPIGELKGSLFYEYRKDQNLRKSVALARDLWLGLFETDLPSSLADDYDMSVGRQYLRLSNFGFPGSRYMGFTLVPSAKRTLYPKRGRLDLSFFIGRERQGAFLDNPAGTNRRDLKLKNRFTGEKIDFYLWKDGRISLGAYHKWGGPTAAVQSKRNFDLDFNLGVPHFRLKGESGLDYRSNVAMHFASIIDNSWFSVENGFLRINPHYNTITGTTLDRGRRGYQLRSSVMPFKPIFGSNALLLTVDADITRELLTLNPRRPKPFNKRWKFGANLSLPYQLKSITTFEYDDKRATSFPYTRRKIRERINRDFSLNSALLRRIRIYGISSLERYGDAVDTLGFNSTRYELGGGVHLSLLKSAWLSAQYLWDRLDEKEPNPPPDGRNYPGQLVIAGGISHTFHRLPLSVNLSTRYTDERKIVSRLHQPFPNEDRFETRGSLNWELPNQGTLFLEASAITARPLNGNPETAEFSLILGSRVNVDTHFYIPQKGLIEGYFFLDKNADGLREPNEPGIAGYEIMVQGGPKTQTDQKGYYRLQVQEGNLKLLAPSKISEGYFFTTVNEQDIEMLPKKKVKVDFGIVPQVQIKGRAYLDVNRNQIFDSGDLPMPAVQITLDSGQLAVTTAQGLYSILRVRPGANQAAVAIQSIPPGYQTVTSIARKFEGMPGDVLTFDVVMTVERSIRGFVFEDKNQNGYMDPGEEGISGVVVTLGNKMAITGGDGRYILADLNPGSEKIRIERESLPKGYYARISELSVDITTGLFVKENANFPIAKPQTEESQSTLP